MDLGTLYLVNHFSVRWSICSVPDLSPSKFRLLKIDLLVIIFQCLWANSWLLLFPIVIPAEWLVAWLTWGCSSSLPVWCYVINRGLVRITAITVFIQVGWRGSKVLCYIACYMVSSKAQRFFFRVIPKHLGAHVNRQ